LLETVALLEEAVAIDPRYAIAHSGLAEAYLNLSSYLMGPKEAMENARAHANRALELDDSIAEAHAALGMTRLFYDWDRDAAKSSVARAIKQNPNSSRGHLLYALSLASEARLDEAKTQLARARELDPLSIEIQMYGALFRLVAREYSLAADEARRILSSEPAFAFGRSILGFALSLTGEHSRGLDELRAAVKQEEIPWTIMFLQHGYALAGDNAEAAKLLRRILDFADRQHLCCYEVGESHAVMGERDEAFRWLDKAVQQRSDCMIWLEVEPWMDPIRSDERYTDLVHRAGVSIGGSRHARNLVKPL